MKVLIISTFDDRGGAAIAAQRLSDALNANGIEASILSRRSLPLPLWKKKWGGVPAVIERLGIFLANGMSLRNLFAIDTAACGEDVTETKAFREADVINLHWINQGFVSLKELRKILCSGKKVVWTMHDAWPTTGICHLTLGCDNFTRECGNCKYLRRKGGNDLSHSVWKKKKALFSQHDITFVTCSRWLYGEAMRSSLLGDRKVTVIPNPIDTAYYAPQDRTACRSLLNLPQDKKLLLFVAQSVSNPYKGMDYLAEAVNRMGDKDVELVMLGGKETGMAERMNTTRVHVMGYVNDADTIRKVYSAADAFVLPSLSENLPNTIMEAMACGTPCVGFNVGGIPEMIDHLENGYVADYKDATSLAEGIRFVTAEGNAERLSEAAREKAVRCYGEKSVAERYGKVYKEQ